jgi:hypothetical protein
MATTQCASCGAPDDGNAVMCKFCDQPVSPDAVKTAVACPQCKLQNRAGKQHCVGCNAWLVVACVFCGQLSPCSEAACTSCHEAFAGSQERKAARDRDKMMQGAMQTVGSVVSMFTGGGGGNISFNSSSSSGSSSSYDSGAPSMGDTNSSSSSSSSSSSVGYDDNAPPMKT